MSGFYRYIMI